MSCIVGIKRKGQIYFASDSLAANGHLGFTVNQKKIFKNGSYLIGYAGSIRRGQIIEFADLPEIPKSLKSEREVYEFLVTDFVPNLMEELDDKGFGATEDESSGILIVAVNGHMFTIDDVFQVTSDVENFVAIGCGADFAYGAYHILSKSSEKARDIVKKCVEASIYKCVAVGGPVNIEKL